MTQLQRAMRMVGVGLVLLAFLGLVSASTVYDSRRGRKEGSFRLDNSGTDYFPGTNRTLEWLGEEGERVQLTFDSVRLFHQSRRRGAEGRGLAICRRGDDKLSILYPTRNGDWAVLKSYCGDVEEAADLLLMSPGSRLRLRLETHPRRYSGGVAEPQRGFQLAYRFVRNAGLEGGDGRGGEGDCYFLAESGRGARSGQFQSPNYPGPYPRDLECIYEFRGRRGERIAFAFEDFQVEGYEDCRSDSASDYLVGSNYRSGEDRRERHYCGGHSPPASVVSDGDFYRFRFVAGAEYDGYGFRARYEFFPARGSPSQIDERRGGWSNYSRPYPQPRNETVPPYQPDPRWNGSRGGGWDDRRRWNETRRGEWDRDERRGGHHAQRWNESRSEWERRRDGRWNETRRGWEEADRRDHNGGRRDGWNEGRGEWNQTRRGLNPLPPSNRGGWQGANATRTTRVGINPLPRRPAQADAPADGHHSHDGAEGCCD